MENIAQNFDNKNIFYLRTYVDDDRMAGGSVQKKRYIADLEDTSFDNVLSSYQPQSDIEPIEMVASPDNSDEFSFLDIIDMVNPLQHIPVVNYIYREITGDEIKPSSKIIGGGIFGGPLGAASGIVNAVIEQETGKDMIGNAGSLVGFGDSKESSLAANSLKNDYKAYEDLPASLLAFSEMPLPAIEYSYNIDPKEKNITKIAQGRTAGTIAVYA